MRDKLLLRLKEKNELKLKELVFYLSELIPIFVNKQRRYKVSDLPDERTLRYYMKEGLIDKPTSYKGRYAIFTYRHVLQILVIKYLQSNYLPLKKIFAVIRKSNDHDLERMLLENKEKSFLGIALDNNLPLEG